MPHKVLVVGAGPSGVQAAHRLLERGLQVEMIDFGVVSSVDWDAVAQGLGFLDFRTCVKDQSALLWGDEYSGFPFDAIPAGAGLTPPRAFTTQEVDESIPLRSREFQAVESLAKGGLGEAWGLGAFVLARAELEAIGLATEELQASYRRVCARIGISGEQLVGALPPLELDEAAESLWGRYRKHESKFLRSGLRARRTPLALLSQPFAGRDATPYSDMDFYLNPGKSAYRPGFDVDALKLHDRFTYTGGWLALAVREDSNGVHVEAKSRKDRTKRTFTGDTVMLCAGTLGTARIALRSGLVGDRTGLRDGSLRLACSPYYRVVAVQPRHVGRALRDRRHSMGQIVMHLEDAKRPEWVPQLSLLSYRSFLLTRLMREAPIPVRQSRPVLHLLQSGLVVAGVFFPQTVEDATARVWLEPYPGSPSGDRLVIEEEAVESSALAEQERVLTSFKRGLRWLGATPLRTLKLPAGSSIHYGGTLPFGSATEPSTGRLLKGTRVFVGDGSPFRMVPGKGVTLTLMAYADWVADRVADLTKRPGATD